MRMRKKGIIKPYFEWVNDYWYSRGKHLDFKKHKYLVKIYKDQKGKGNGIIVYQKSAQAGLTEKMITEAMWLPDQYDYNSIYFFPTTGTLGDLVSERIDRPINDSKYLLAVSGRARVVMGKHADRLGLKRMSKGFVYFRGSNALPSITSIAGDAIFVDEVDRMDIENIPYFEKRLEHSDLRYQRWTSTPTIPGFGINKRFKESDQCVWLVKCNHCGEKQELDFFKNVDIKNEKIICIKCKKKIIPFELEGEWVAKYSEKEIRGYHICQLYSPKLNLKKLIQDSQYNSESEIQQFYNQNLGLPYEAKGAKLTDVELDNCKQNYNAPEYTQETLFMGVDVGKKLHYIVRTKERIVAIGDVDNFTGINSIEEIINNFKIHGVVIDALPETRKVQELIQKFPYKIKMCYYSGLSEIREAGVYWKIDEDKINTDRTIAIDMIFAEFKQKKIGLPKNLDNFIDFKLHLKSTIRIIRENAKGIQKAEYVEVGDDHYLHGCVYSKLAVNIFDVNTPEIFII